MICTNNLFNALAHWTKSTLTLACLLLKGGWGQVVGLLHLCPDTGLQCFKIRAKTKIYDFLVNFNNLFQLLLSKVPNNL